MSNTQNPSTRLRGPLLQIDTLDDNAQHILKALASRPRIQVLELLRDRVLNVSEIAEKLDWPLSTANMHILNLEKAGLLMFEHKPGARGMQKLCSRVYDRIIIQLPHGSAIEERVIEHAMPVGAFVSCEVTPTCGLASEYSVIGFYDDPTSFYEPQRTDAQLIWFHHGYLEYRFPNRLASTGMLDSIQLSMEIGSEAPLHSADWPSDITLWINDVEIGTWTCPGDFGGQRGVLTPDWWEIWNSQYGLLKVWQVNGEGSYIDGVHLSDRVVSDLHFLTQPFISVKIGVKAGAKHVGGLNIYGRKFGNYAQDMILRLHYH